VGGGGEGGVQEVSEQEGGRERMTEKIRRRQSVCKREAARTNTSVTYIHSAQTYTLCAYTKYIPT